jgi:DnaJ-class molecular chaperone
MNPWRILGVHRRTSEEDIRAAYIALAKRFHPDAAKTAEEAAKFCDIQKAYATLKTKGLQNQFLTSVIPMQLCSHCEGRGTRSHGRGIIERTYTSCPVCGGSGLANIG